MTCGCEYGTKCTKVSTCHLEDAIRQALQDAINEVREWNFSLSEPSAVLEELLESMEAKS